MNMISAIEGNSYSISESIARNITIGSFLFILIMSALSFCIFFLPTIVALLRKHNNFLSIMVLNIFLGWTIFGWLGALVWSLINKPVKIKKGRKRK